MELINPILEKPITSLETSVAFREMCNVNGFTTLSVIIELPVYVLEKATGMTKHLYIEFFQIIKKYGLEGMMREE